MAAAYSKDLADVLKAGPRQSNRWLVRKAALQCLGAIGSAAACQGKHIFHSLNDESDVVRSAAEKVLRGPLGSAAVTKPEQLQALLSNYKFIGQQKQRKLTEGMWDSGPADHKRRRL